MTERVRPSFSRESAPFNPNLIGLQARLLLGNTALNPAHNISEHFDPATITAFDRRSYSTFETASKSERSEFWNASGINNLTDQLTVWSHSMSSLISTKSFSKSEREFYAKIGIDTGSFSSEDTSKFYRDNFANNPNKLKSFVEKVIRAHFDESSLSIDYDALMSNMDTIKWFANIFGQRSAEIATQLIAAEIKLITEPELFTQDPGRLNNLTPTETELLGFAWQHRTENEQNNHSQEESEAFEIADRLIDYKTGSVTGERVDLLPYYSGFVDDMSAKLDSNHPLFGGREPKIILSDLAVAMIDRVASRSNEVNKELGFTIQGNSIGQEGEFIFTGAYIAPVLDFTTAQESTMSPDFTLNNRLKKLLGQNTNLSNYFLQTTGRKTGDRLGTLHIHQAPLGEKYRAQPSTGDIAYVERILQSTKRKFYIWGVVTKSGGDLEMIVVLSKRDQSGTIVHDEIPVIYESQLDEALPQAA